jgi:nicotinate-nucleotide adenylyltransferase
MKIAFGGTFNPVHFGHLISARAVGEALGADIVLVPCNRQPHKGDSAEMASAADRLEMCRLAVQGVPGFEVDDCEIKRGGASFTIETVRELKAAGWGEVHWLIGMDQVKTLSSWRESEALLREAKLVVMSRAGCEGNWAGTMVTVPEMEISATEIRRRVGAGLPIDFLTPPAVVEFIRRRKLWQGGGRA